MIDIFKGSRTAPDACAKAFGNEVICYKQFDIMVMKRPNVAHHFAIHERSKSAFGAITATLNGTLTWSKIAKKAC